MNQENTSRELRHVFSRLGLALFALLAVTFAGQLFLGTIAELVGLRLAEHDFLRLLFSLGPIYLVAFPLFLLLMHRVKGEPVSQNTLKPGHLLMFFIMSVTLLYAGNFLGLGVTALLQHLFGIEATFALQDIVLGTNPWINFLFIVILAPVVEEIVFRKVLIDKTARFGPSWAVFISGLFFGLFHGNFNQFFYAFALGLLLAYIYVTSGRLRYVIGLHMLINFLGSIVAPALLRLIDLDAVDQVAGIEDPELLLETLGDSLLGLFLLGSYVLLMIGLSITGLVLLIVRRKHFRLPPAEDPLPRSRKAALTFGNVGTILFLIGCGVLFALSLFL